MSTQHSQSYLQKRKMMVALPFLATPFLFAFFWILGGGKGVTEATGSASIIASGLNMNIPEVSDKQMIYESKMKAYEREKQDSLNLKKKTAFSFLDRGSLDSLVEGDSSSLSMFTSSQANVNNSAFNADLNYSKEEKENAPENIALQEALKEIEETEKITAVPPKSQTAYRSSYSGASGYAPRQTPMTKQEQLLEESQKAQQELLALVKQRMEDERSGALYGQKPQEEANPFQASHAKKGVKVKVDDKQKPVVSRLDQKVSSVGGNPTLIVEPVKQVMSGTVYNAGSSNGSTSSGASSAQSTTPRANNGFYSPEKSPSAGKDAPNVIMAVIHEGQTVENGSTVKIRLLNNIQVARTLIPKGSFVFGICSLNGERLDISINNIYYRESIFDLDLTVYDMDGIQGLSMPGSVGRTAAKQGAGQAVGNTNFIGTSPTVQSQLTQTAIEVGKNIVTKKAQIVRVTLKPNYQILLKPKEVVE